MPTESEPFIEEQTNLNQFHLQHPLRKQVVAIFEFESIRHLFTQSASFQEAIISFIKQSQPRELNCFKDVLAMNNGTFRVVDLFTADSVAGNNLRQYFFQRNFQDVKNIRELASFLVKPHAREVFINDNLVGQHVRNALLSQNGLLESQTRELGLLLENDSARGVFIQNTNAGQHIRELILKRNSILEHENGPDYDKIHQIASFLEVDNAKNLMLLENATGQHLRELIIKNSGMDSFSIPGFKEFLEHNNLPDAFVGDDHAAFLAREMLAKTLGLGPISIQLIADFFGNEAVRSVINDSEPRRESLLELIRSRKLHSNNIERVTTIFAHNKLTQLFFDNSDIGRLFKERCMSIHHPLTIKQLEMLGAVLNQNGAEGLLQRSQYARDIFLAEQHVDIDLYDLVIKTLDANNQDEVFSDNFFALIESNRITLNNLESFCILTTCECLWEMFNSEDALFSKDALLELSKAQIETLEHYLSLDGALESLTTNNDLRALFIQSNASENPLYASLVELFKTPPHEKEHIKGDLPKKLKLILSSTAVDQWKEKTLPMITQESRFELLLSLPWKLVHYTVHDTSDLWDNFRNKLKNSGVNNQYVNVLTRSDLFKKLRPLIETEFFTNTPNQLLNYDSTTPGWNKISENSALKLLFNLGVLPEFRNKVNSLKEPFNKDKLFEIAQTTIFKAMGVLEELELAFNCKLSDVDVGKKFSKAEELILNKLKCFLPQENAEHIMLHKALVSDDITLAAAIQLPTGFLEFLSDITLTDAVKHYYLGLRELNDNERQLPQFQSGEDSYVNLMGPNLQGLRQSLSKDGIFGMFFKDAINGNGTVTNLQRAFNIPDNLEKLHLIYRHVPSIESLVGLFNSVFKQYKFEYMNQDSFNQAIPSASNLEQANPCQLINELNQWLDGVEHQDEKNHLLSAVIHQTRKIKEKFPNIKGHFPIPSGYVKQADKAKIVGRYTEIEF